MATEEANNIKNTLPNPSPGAKAPRSPVIFDRACHPSDAQHSDQVTALFAACFLVCFRVKKRWSKTGLTRSKNMWAMCAKVDKKSI